MCLAAIAIGAHPRFALVVAANRDEFHDRPAAAASEWADRAGAYGGRDLAAGGAWLAADRRGRVALVTNVRRPAAVDGQRSRGMLVRDLLLADEPIECALERLVAQAGDFAPFNLIAGHADRLYYLSHDQPAPVSLAAAIHTLSNAALDTPWPKTERLRCAMQAWCGEGDAAIDTLFAALADSAAAGDSELPNTGVGIDRERFLSAPFIVGESYGTRCSTVYSLDHDGNASLIECSFGPLCRPLGRVELRWRIESS